MAEINRKAFFRKLNSVGYKCFEAATIAAKTAGNPYIEIVHLINQASRSRIRMSIRSSTPSASTRPGSRRTCSRPSAKLPRGGGSYVDFSSPVMESRSGFLEIRLPDVQPAEDPHRALGGGDGQGPCPRAATFWRSAGNLKRSSPSSSPTISRRSPPRARRRAWRQGWGRRRGAPRRARPAGPWPRRRWASRRRSKKFTVDLTEKARKGEIDPIVGRDEEIRQMRRHPHAPPPEQPDPHRRGRRRQNRRRRRASRTASWRRRAARAQGRHRSARWTSACSRPARA